MAAFDWKSLIPDLGALGGSILGDTFAPAPQQQQAQEQKRMDEFNMKLALQKMAQSNSIRQSVMPGMYTSMGFSPMQGQQMTANYGQSAAGMPGGAPSNGGGIGKKIAKGVLGGALSILPGMIKP